MSSDGDEHPAIRFIRTVFGPSTTENVYVCSLANSKGEPGPPERSISDRDAAIITTFLNRWNIDGRGCYVCLSTIKAGMRRQKPNAAETPAFQIDIDFKGVAADVATIVKALRQCRYPPTLIVHSGHGLHAWWLLKEALSTQDYLERIETVQKLLADTFAADLAVAHVVALMRLPGTLNTKDGPGQSLDVICSDDNGLRYELEDLEEWMGEQSPLLRRKERPAEPVDNPYKAIADRFGWKPPLDVQRRLADMVYQGAGDKAIHVTQRAVTASLVSQGIEVDEIVAMVLEATRHAAGDYGSRWNWRIEERNIRRMCVTWAEKLEQRRAASGGERGERVVNFAEARERAQGGASAKPSQPPPTDKGKKFHLVAEAVLAGLAARDEAILFETGVAWHYEKGVWARLPDLKSWLNVEIENACRLLKILGNNHLRSEVRGCIEANPDLVGTGSWDRHGLVPTGNGLVDPLTGDLTPARAEHYATWCVACDYDPEASCPFWLEMLNDTFADRAPEGRAAVIGTLQECLGAALIDNKSRALHKALVLIGGANCGKSEILNVFGGLFGNDVIAQPIGATEKHGLMPFLTRLPWVLNEAFNQNVWHMSDIVKTLITGEEVGIDVKWGPVLRHRFLGPIFWATNHPPQFKESTRAIIDRLLIIDCRQEFREGQPLGVARAAESAGFRSPSALVLAREKPGVLLWALRGLRRALERGRIQTSQEMTEAATQIYRDSNLVRGFIEDGSVPDPDIRLAMPDFCVAFSAWFAENRGENRNLPSNDSIGRALVALHDPRIVIDRYELRDNAKRYVIGIRLNEQGLDYHKRGITADAFEGKTVNATPAEGVVNKPIPAAWDTKPKVIAMRAAHARAAEISEKEVSLGPDTSSVTVTPVNEEVSSAQVIDLSSSPLF
jgi:hypothetical protein